VFLVVLNSSAALAKFTIKEINPDHSTLHDSDPDGATGGRVNGLASVSGDNEAFYSASEWGGIYNSTDSGHTWFRLNRHLPTATWHVSVDPSEPRRIYATSFYDGRVNSLAGINVSTDGGDHWTHPPTAVPPPGLCFDNRRLEPSAFGISVDRDNPRNVYIGTNCGLAISNDQGATWKFVAPLGIAGFADNVWDVVVHDKGIIDICGDDGHLRSTDGGVTWISGTGLPSGLCSIAVSPFEANVLFVAVGVNVWESDDGGATWTNLGTPDYLPQGRIPFVATNPRGGTTLGATFDLWYGDVRLYRDTCAVGGIGLRCPMGRIPAPPALQPPPPGWNGPFTRTVGGHDDVGGLVFDTAATVDACPKLFASDGGVYFNTKDANPDCQTPAWQEPAITPHGLWLFAMGGAHELGGLYFGTQDNGIFATGNPGAASPTWNNVLCCDAFDVAPDPARVVFTQCCDNPKAPPNILVAGPGLVASVKIKTPPPGNLPRWNFPDFIARFGDNQYIAVTDSGAFITTDITSNPVVWTQLGASSSPAGGFCAVKVAVSGGTPTFYAQTACLGGQLWKYTGTAPGNTWRRVDNNSGLNGGFGVFAVHPRDPDRLYASNLGFLTGPQMVFSRDGGTTWSNDAKLDTMMTGNGTFKYQTQRGPTDFTGFNGYPQPSLVAFDPDDPNLVVAGGIDSGVFISQDSGVSWQLATDPFDSGNSGVPHIPRPWFAYFDHESPGRVTVYIGTQGRGVWSINFESPQLDFEYAAKVVCGVQNQPDDRRLARGAYATNINIHNPDIEAATFFKKLALTLPPGLQGAGKVISIGMDELGSDQALEADCPDIVQKIGGWPATPAGPAAYFEGFLVIQSDRPLDVTAVYTTAGLDAAVHITGPNSINVQQIQASCPRKTQDVFTKSDEFAGDRCWPLGPLHEDRTYGSACDAGFHREQCLVSVFDACDVCTAIQHWTSPDTSDCRCTVHYHTPEDCSKHIRANIEITETQNVRSVRCP
jgi:photosystem II stability/assembly factor-like uncharacterized protein